MRRLISFVVPIAALLASQAAEAQVLRFSTTAPGDIVAIGNTLGLAKETNLNGPGIRDSIGTFLSLGGSADNNPINLANPWPVGTTNDWTMSGSTANLSLPVESTVLYAELLWGGSYEYGTENVFADLGDSITLSKGAASTQVAPSNVTALTAGGTAASGFNIRYYMRSADVTAFIQANQAGQYAVSGVPATQTTTINSLNASGWTLVVVYRDQSVGIRNLSVFVGGSFVDEDSQQDYAVSGFCAPPAGVVWGTAAVSAIEGDANLVGDQFLIAPTSAGPFASLSGPNNPASNFFSSQINDAFGQLETSGSFGMANHDAQNGMNLSGGRQGWDITSIPLSSQNGQLTNGQTSAVLRTITTGDSYMPILAAFAIDVNAPEFDDANSSADATPSSVTTGDQFVVTATLENQGSVTADNVLFTVDLPPEVSLASFTSDGMNGDINGTAVTAATLQTGVDEGDLSAGQTRTVTLTLEVDTAPATTTLFGLTNWAYNFQVCTGGSLESEDFVQFFSVNYTAPQGTGGGGGAGGDGGAGGAEATGAMGGSGGSSTTTMAGGSPASGGESPGGMGGGGATGGNAGEGGISGNDGPETGLDGCSCRTGSGTTRFGSGLAWLGAALALGLGRRVRREPGQVRSR